MKTWFITGANRGLGLEIGNAALASGDRVVFTSRNADSLLGRFAGQDRALAIPLDMTDTQSIEAAVADAVRHFGRIDVLVNNAGYGQLGAFEQLSEQAISRQFSTNVFGTFAVTRAVLPLMRAQRAGHVVSITSIAGLVGFGGSSMYCASKFAIEGWSEALAQELKQFGIVTTLVEPGQFRTDFLDASSVRYGDLEVADYVQYSEEKRRGLDAVSHRQLGEPRKLGAAIVALVASPHPPLRFAAGSDAYEVVVNRARTQLAEAESWRQLSLSTDFA
ncbi:short-chain dehydrogenase/reductase [Bordetella genomosp. 8]|uniref:Short-chain dehydrogenase/reductase n=1 Tax=Bordetella genomosp. 8 TaxID=1416806 RepID=A0A1W6YUK3_9BORD|nr:oxidoreductase [Bordetella genomosp. 8]ARP84658.1 short-chain dehydrogenase/reductase [Bordetella genomosp. 8]